MDGGLVAYFLKGPAMRIPSYAIAAVAAAVSFPASADIVLVDASSIQGDNVLFNNGVQTGTSVDGHTQAGTVVRFTGTTFGGGTIIRANGGQARIEGMLDASTMPPNDTLALTSLGFGLLGGNTFNNLEFNIFGGGATSATFSLIDNEGTVFDFTQALGNGSNFFGFVGINGQSIASASLSFNGTGIGDVRQIRLDEVVAAVVPEPATWGLMLLGFGALGAGMRRHRARGSRMAFAF